MTALEETSPAAAPEHPGAARRVRPRTLILSAALVALLALLAAAPYIANLTTILTLEEISAFAVFAVAANLLIGQAGLVSFGQGVFFGLGA